MSSKKEFEDELIKLKQATNSIEEFKEDFKKYFKTKMADRIKSPVLESVYYDFIEQIYRPTTIYQFLLDEMCKVYDELQSSLDEKGKETLKKYEFLNSQMLDDFGLQNFIYGYSLANALNDESSNYINNNITVQKKLNKLKESTDNKK